jgi:predicted transcriptional regulator
MKAVLASIKPRHTANIKAGKKSLEVRKTVPTISNPFKVYVYETKDGGEGAGAVVCEFVCDYIAFMQNLFDGSISQEDCQAACLTEQEILDYAAGKTVYGWHISGLKVYEKPKPLSWFVTEGDCNCMNCKKCGWFNKGNGYNVEDDCDLGYENIGRETPLKPLFRPPQSWCYVEDTIHD